MIKLIIRIAIAISVAVILSTLHLCGNTAVLQTLFTVLGIVFSISMSLLVSFSLSKILNRSKRTQLRASIIHTRNMLLSDFITSTFFLLVALIWNTQNLSYTYGRITIEIPLISVTIVSVSLIYEIYNFRKLHQLHTDIEDAIIDEETEQMLHQSMNTPM